MENSEALGYIGALNQGGFVFDNCQRNANLQSANPQLKLEKTMKTGTTIVGLVFKVRLFFAWKIPLDFVLTTFLSV